MNRPGGYLVKLVRDRVVGGNGTVTYAPMSPDEHRKRLRAKLVEESIEYLLDPSLTELAHVWEVMRVLAYVDLDVSLLEVEHEAAREYRVRGGFDDGIGMYAHHPCDRETG